MKTLAPSFKIQIGKALILSLLLGFSIPMFVYSQTSQQQEVTDGKKITELARGYDLFNPSPFVYSFEDKDVKYWAEQKLPEEGLRNEFRARQVVRGLAEKTGYRMADGLGNLTSGNLSYWAEKIVKGDHPASIQREFETLRKDQDVRMGVLGKKYLKPEAVHDGKVIYHLAQENGLMTPNEFAWTFQDGDIIWYAEQGMTRDELAEEFRAKAIVREAAKKTGFRVTGHSGKLTAGDLSYWAEFIRQEQISPDRLEEIFAAKSRS